jgi:hypothetical protein
VNALRVKIFQADAESLEDVVNAWLEENPKAEVRDAKLSPVSDGRAMAMLLYFEPKESKGLGFAR